MENMNEMKIFRVRTLNEEQSEFIVTVGNHLATEKHFSNEEDAEKYISEKNWDMIVALVAEMIEISKNKEGEK